MSLQVAFVCEGPTDTPILEAVVEAVFGPDFESLYLQPERDTLSDEESWGDGNDDRVRGWCLQRADSLEWAVYTADVIVIHLDADRCAKFGTSSTEELCQVIRGWLGRSADDERLVIVLPAQASEAWLVAAHCAPAADLESQKRPAEQLAAAGLIERDEEGRPRKDRARYEDLSKRLSNELPRIRAVLHELERFASKLERQAQRLG